MEDKMRKAMMIVTVLALLPAYIPALAQSSVAAHDQHAEHMAFNAVAQDWAKERADKSPRHQEWVKVTTNSKPQRDRVRVVLRGHPFLFRNDFTAQKRDGHGGPPVQDYHFSLHPSENQNQRPV
jgi:hypothetical protein